MEKFEDLINSEVPVLVDFFATWCGPCKMMHPILEDLKKRMGDAVKIIKMDVDAEANHHAAVTYQIRSVPTLMIFRRGKMLWRQSGVLTVDELEQTLKKLS